ncbi:MAG TPA: ParA family protein [Clostridiales bacterium]|nr:ParA family protein [Clostridiales bacterium]
MTEIKSFTIICGHYGCGKTNLSLNLAIDAAKRGESVTLVDMDIVNPYFRSSEYIPLLNEYGISVIAPSFANTTLDTPSLSAEIFRIFESDGTVIIDAGGDDSGSTALGSFSGRIGKIDYDMLYVINRYRPLASEPESASMILREIERASRLRATGVVNNSHLKEFTTQETILESLGFARETAATLGLPLMFTTAPKEIATQLNIERLYPIEIYVKTPWGT